MQSPTPIPADRCRCSRSSTAGLSSQTAAAPSLIPDVPNGVYQVALTVTDQLGNVSAPAFVAITASSCGAVPPRVSSVGVTTVPDFTIAQDVPVNGGVTLHLVHA